MPKFVSEKKVKKPKWLKVKLPTGEAYKHVKTITRTNKLHTSCKHFPNNH